MKLLLSILYILFCNFLLISQNYPKNITSNKIYEKNHCVFKSDGTPLNGFYKIKYNSRGHKNRAEISYLKNGFRYGNSKILRGNKLSEEGTYFNGLKYGTWKNYNLNITSTYKNGLKNGKEFGNKILKGKFVCNYVNDSLDGPMIIYDSYYGYLESKTQYKKGEKISYIRYDHFLNITEEHYFVNTHKKITIQTKVKKIKGSLYLDSIFYNNKVPYKSKTYKNNTFLFQKEILIKKDNSREDRNDYVFVANFYNRNWELNSVYMYYDETLVNDSTIAKYCDIIINKAPFGSCDFINHLLVFTNLKQINLYEDNYTGLLLNVTNPSLKDTQGECRIATIKKKGKTKQSY
ncbi:hypothetical protein OAT18_01330 [Tenacibaculum sp.]|nr:hypothetical protein [Tenacibaculum sp.]